MNSPRRPLFSEIKQISVVSSIQYCFFIDIGSLCLDFSKVEGLCMYSIKCIISQLMWRKIYSYKGAILTLIPLILIKCQIR